MSGVYAIVGGSNEAGATTVATALGSSLAEGPLRVCVVDADHGGSSLADAVGMTVDGPTIETVLRGQATLLDATYERSRDFVVVPGETREWRRDANVRTAADVIDVVRKRYDVVLLDVGRGNSLEAAMWTSLADRAVLVATLDEEALATAADGRRVSEYLGTPVAGVVVNRVDAGGTPDLAAVERRVGTSVLAAVPYDESAVASAAVGEPVIEYDPDSPSARAFWELAARIGADDLPDDPVVPTPLSAGLDDDSMVDPGAQRRAAVRDARESADAGDRRAVAAADAGGEVGSDTAAEPGDGAGDEEDPVAAAFKQRMEQVSERRAEADDPDREKGLFDRLFD